jgi:hypothetical protein
MLKTPNRERSIVMRDKENTRSRKWRNMATRAGPRPGSSDSAQGSGAEWSFNTSDSKLISRTWKGIPDCWRGAAWHSFLTESYKKRGIGRPDYELIQIYSVRQIPHIHPIFLYYKTLTPLRNSSNAPPQTTSKSISTSPAPSPRT